MAYNACSVFFFLLTEIQKASPVAQPKEEAAVPDLLQASQEKGKSSAENISVCLAPGQARRKGSWLVPHVLAGKILKGAKNSLLRMQPPAPLPPLHFRHHRHLLGSEAPTWQNGRGTRGRGSSGCRPFPGAPPHPHLHLHRLAVHLLPCMEAGSDRLRVVAQHRRHRPRRLALCPAGGGAPLPLPHHPQLRRQLPHLPLSVTLLF